MKARIARVAPANVLFTFPHGAIYFDAPYSTFRKLAADGAFPVVRVGNRLYVRKSDLDAFIESNVDRSCMPQASERQIAAQRERRQRERKMAGQKNETAAAGTTAVN